MNQTTYKACGTFLCLLFFSFAPPPPPPDWTALGSGLNGFARTNAIDNSGNIYVGGGFTQAGGIAASRIARWNGTNWSAMGTGFSSTCNTIAIKNPNEVYAGGVFISAGGNIVNYIAQWNGTSWQALGSGLNGECLSVVLDQQGNLYAGGFFTQAGGSLVNYIAKWDGTTWQSLGTGLNARCEAIAVDAAGNVYAGGYFTQAGGMPASYVAKWDGTTWSALGLGFNNTVQSLGISPTGDLYAGGAFTQSGGAFRNRIARLDGTAWAALGTGLGGVCHKIAFNHAGELLAGGSFITAGGNPATLIAQWDGFAWSPIGSGLGGGSGVYGIVVNETGYVFAAGQFTFSGSLTGVNHVARWDGEPLAAAFSFFEATATEERVHLWWETAPETQTGEFRVFHSPDAINWALVDRVPFQMNITNAYATTHVPANGGKHYYRVVSQSVDGHTAYSQVVEVWFESKTGTAIFPNPTSQWINLHISEDPPYNLNLYDASGKRIASFWSYSRQLDLSPFPDGSYFLNITTPDRSFFVSIEKRNER